MSMATRYFISPTVSEQYRINMGVMQAHERGGPGAVAEFIMGDVKGKALTIGAGITALTFPGAITQMRNIPSVVMRRMTFGEFLRIYGGNFLPFPSIGIAALKAVYDRLKESPRQDMTSAPGAGQIPKTRGGTKSSRAAKSAPRTSKPFWSNGQPKCREGYRYDFKRKLCVKKS
jgi:hypothetical protein